MLSYPVNRELLGQLLPQRRILAGFLFVLIRSVFDPRTSHRKKGDSSRLLVYNPRINIIIVILLRIIIIIVIYYCTTSTVSFVQLLERVPLTFTPFALCRRVPLLASTVVRADGIVTNTVLVADGEGSTAFINILNENETTY